MTDQELFEQMLPLYNKGWGLRQLAKKFDMSKYRVGNILRAHGVNTSVRCTRVPQERPYNLVKPMTEYGLTIAFIAKRVGIKEETVSGWRKAGLTYENADLVAVRCGFMPQDFWDDWFDFE